MILVTGGCGFIGSHIVDALIDSGHEVVALDNLSAGNLADLNPLSKFFQADVTNKEQLDILFDKYPIKAVCHHAAQISVPISMKDPVFDINENILGTVNLLQACVEHKVERFVFASSAAIYGNPEYLPIDEKHNKNPLSFYGLSKLAAEYSIKIFAETYNISYGIMRYANVYGPRQRAAGEGGVVAVFMDNMINDKQCYIHGEGKQSRDFIYVKDIAAANVKALTVKENFTANVSTSDYTDINTLFSVMKKMTGYNKEAEYTAARKGDIQDSYLLNTDIHSILSWHPRYKLEDGLKETVEYFKK